MEAGGDVGRAVCERIVVVFEVVEVRELRGNVIIRTRPVGAR